MAAPVASDHDSDSASHQRAAVLLCGCLVAALPVVLLWLPLLAHRSVTPALGSYSPTYLRILVLAAVAGAALVLVVGLACRRAGSLFPAVMMLVVLVASAGAALVAEVVLAHRLGREDAFAEYRAWGHERSLLFAFEAQPSHRWQNAGATYSTDQFGFRTHARGPWEDAAGPRIFTVGESSVFGYGLNDDETWPHLLEGELRARAGDPSLVVVNAGNNGHTTIQTLFRFYERVVPRRPTHVIVYVGPNDVYATGRDHLLITGDILFQGSVAEYWAAATAGKNLYERSFLFYAMQQAIPALAPPTRKVAAPATAPTVWGRPEAEAIARRYVRNVRTLCVVARANGVEPVIATFVHDLPASVPFPPLAIRTMNDGLRALAIEEHVRLVDLEAAFRDVPEKARYFSADHYHPSAEGARFIAATLADAWR